VNNYAAKPMVCQGNGLTLPRYLSGRRPTHRMVFMNRDVEAELRKRIEELQSAVVAIMWIGGAAIGALVLRVFFGL
jgi:hypothetical protein